MSRNASARHRRGRDRSVTAVPLATPRGGRPRGGSNSLVPAAVALLVLAAFLVRLPGIRAGLPQVYEEAYPFKLAWDMWGFGTGSKFDLDPHFFRYPSLVVYLQFLGQAAVLAVLSATGAVRSALDAQAIGIADPTAFYLVGRGLNALAGALAAWATLRLGRAAGLRAGAWVAAVAVALNAPLIAQSHLIDVDVPLTLLVALGLTAALRLHERGSTRAALVAGAVAGLAASAKYPGVLLLVPCAVAIAMPRPAHEGTPAGPGSWRRIARGLAIVVGSAVVAFALTSPFVLIDARHALDDLSAERQHQLLGHFGNLAIPSWAYFATAWAGRVAGVPLALAALAGFAWAAWARRGWVWVAASFAVAFGVVLTRTQVQADRYLLPLIPVAAVFAGSLVEGLLALPALARLRAGLRGGVAGAAVIALVAPHAAAIARHTARGGADSRTEAKRWIESHIPTGSMIVSEAYGPPLLGPVELMEYEPALREALARRGYGRQVYAVQLVPSFQVVPRRSARFYHLALYRDADAFVVSDAVRSRYAEQPDSFAVQLALYDSLPSRFPFHRVFPPAGDGPALTLYWHDRPGDRFADRAPSGPDSSIVRLGTSTGGEDFFHYNLGANFEAFGMPRAAAMAYQMCLRYPGSPDRIHTKAAIRLAGLMLHAGRRDLAVRVLRDAEADPKDEDEARVLGEMRRRIEAGR